MKTFLFFLFAAPIQSAIIYGFTTNWEFDEGAGGPLWVGIILTCVEAAALGLIR